MRNLVVVGGTDGIGRAVALHYLRRGDRVAVIGVNTEKGAGFLAEAERLGSGGRAHFLPADLSLVADTRRIIDELRVRFPVIDALVLTARHFRSDRLVTAEGFEHTFALYYLSRYLLGTELSAQLNAADRPVIMNIAGPGASAGELPWDDLDLSRDYDGMAAMAYGGRLNDLLAVDHVRRDPDGHASYVLLHPGQVATGFSGQYHPEVAVEVDRLRHTARPVGEAIRPILALLDDPPAERLHLSVMGTPLAADGPAFDADDAARLHDLTVERLAALRLDDVGPTISGMTRERLHAVLDSPVFGVVSTIQPDGTPQQTPVWIRRDGDDVLFMMAKGSRKERNLRRDPRASVLINPADAPHTYAAIRGTVSLHDEGSRELRDQLSRKYIGVDYAEHVRQTPEAGHDTRDIVMARLRPQRVVGRL